MTIPPHLADANAATIAAELGISRQYAYQLLRRRDGLCVACGKPAREGKTHCEKHARRALRHTRASQRRKKAA